MSYNRSWKCVVCGESGDGVMPPRHHLPGHLGASLPDKAFGGSPPCPRCGRHSPTWAQPPEEPQQRACLHPGCEHRWTEERKP